MGVDEIDLSALANMVYDIRFRDGIVEVIFGWMAWMDRSDSHRNLHGSSFVGDFTRGGLIGLGQIFVSSLDLAAHCSAVC